MLMARSRIPNIAFVLQGLGAGGSEHVVSQLCNHFATRGWKVTLLAFDERDTAPYYEHHPAVQVIPLGLKSKKQHPLAALRYSYARLKLLRASFATIAPDLVVSFLTRTNVLSILAAGRNGPPVLVSERNNPALQKVGPIWELLRRHSYPRAAGLVTMTNGAMNYFPPAVRPRPWVIPNPATLPRATAPRKAEGRTIGAVGRLVTQKGFDLLIDAFARCAHALPEWRLVIWGEGPERDALERQRDALGLTDRVLMPGVTREAGGWIGETDVFVLSSRFEGWGLVLSEAMAAGLPVVSMDCEWGPGDMIEAEKSGLLVPNGNTTALGAALLRLCSDPDLRRRLGDAARDRMTAFEPSRVLQLWETTIEQLIEENVEVNR